MLHQQRQTKTFLSSHFEFTRVVLAVLVNVNFIMVQRKPRESVAMQRTRRSPFHEQDDSFNSRANGCELLGRELSKNIVLGTGMLRFPKHFASLSRECAC